MNVLAKSKLLGALLLIVPASSLAAPPVTGTYSTLSINEESGDLTGLEVALIPVDAGLVASVQIAMDGINEVHLANVTHQAGQLRFSPRLDDGSAVDFSMECTPASCIGRYLWGNAEVDFTLPKSGGYWNDRHP